MSHSVLVTFTDERGEIDITECLFEESNLADCLDSMEEEAAEDFSRSLINLDISDDGESGVLAVQEEINVAFPFMTDSYANSVVIDSIDNSVLEHGPLNSYSYSQISTELELEKRTAFEVEGVTLTVEVYTTDDNDTMVIVINEDLFANKFDEVI